MPGSARRSLTTTGTPMCRYFSRMSTESVDRDRRRWEPIFVNTPVHESATAMSIRTALIETVGERGSKAVTLEAVIERAGIDRAEFDREYDSLEESYIDAWVFVISDFLRRSEAAFARGGEDWPECLRHQAWDLLRFVEENVNEARFLIEMTFADELVQANRDIAMARMTTTSISAATRARTRPRYRARPPRPWSGRSGTGSR